MKRLIFILFTFLSCHGYTQEDTLIYQVQDVEPEFPGGFSAMIMWIQNSVQEKSLNRQDLRCFSSVFLEFVVEKDGSISDLRSKSKCTAEMTHFQDLFKDCPKWTPGQYKGKVVRSMVRLPLHIEFEE